MRTLAFAFAVGVLIAGTPARAAADWQITPLLGLTFQGETTLLDSESAVGKAHWHFGGAVSVVGSGVFGAVPPGMATRASCTFCTVPVPGRKA